MVGRSDLLLKGAKALNMQLNLRKGSNDVRLVPVPHVAGGLGTPNITLADINGDGRADYLL